MRADDAKRLPLDQILARLGYSPVRTQKNGQEIWYTSPFRDEKDASLHISTVTHPRLGTIWVWKDFGDVGGSVITFIQRYYGLAEKDVSGVLARLDELGVGGVRTKVKAPSPAALPLPFSSAKQESATPGHPFTDVQIEPLSSNRLTTYLADRGIDAGLARRYVKQVRYSLDGKQFTVLAFPNDVGGYELRSTGRFKGTLPPKGITLLYREKSDCCREVAVFEGFVDYLSALTYYKRPEATTPVIVLNSATMQDQAIEAIKELGAEKVHLYLDRDTTGSKLAESFRDALADGEVIDQSDLYDGYKDFNEFLMAMKQEKSR